MKNIYLALTLSLLLISGNAFAGDLIDAISANNLAKVKTLLADTTTRAAGLAESDKNGYSPLLQAVRDNRGEIVRELVTAGANVNQTSGILKLTPLHSASNIDIIKYLIANKAAVDAKDSGGNTPLTSATRNGRIDIMNLLIESGANVNLANIDGQTPIFLASTPEIAKVLLDAKADLGITDKNGNSPLITKIIDRQTDTAIWLINNHVSIEKANNDGDTPLHIAAKFGNDTVTDELIKKGAGVGATNKNGDTPLHFAATAAVANLLLKAGSAADIMNNNKLIPIVAIAERGNDEAAIAMITRANANAAGENGITLLHNFAGRGNTEAVRKLIELGADVNAVTRTVKQTPLHMAATKDVAELLLNNGAKMESADIDGNTPLIRALQNNNNILVEYYLQQKASTTKRNANGDTPLHFVRSAKAVDLVLAADKLLLNIMNKPGGETPLFNAIANDNKEAAIELINAGAEIDVLCDGTPILVAAIAKAEKTPDWMEVLKALLDKKPDVNILNDKKTKPISLTSKTNIIMLLAQHGADLSSSSMELGGRTPLFYVVINSALENEKAAAPENIKSLLAIHADVNRKDFSGNTPLFYAPSVEIAEILLNNPDEKNRASINAVNNYGESLLFRAVSGNRIELVKYYLDKKLSASQPNDNKDTPLHRAAFIIDPPFVQDLEHLTKPAPHEIATMLVNAGADVNAKNDNGETPLFNARSAAMISYLVKDCKADPNIANLNGDTALMKIARTNKDAVDALVNNGVTAVDVNHVNNNKKSAIFMALNADIADVLIKAKANVNLKDAAGGTPLHDAVRANRVDVVNALVNAGADATVRSIDGNLPMHLAANADIATAILAAPKTDVNAIIETGIKDDVNSTGDTMLHIAARKADGLPLVEMLMAKNASVIIANKKLETPLHVAATDDILFALVKNGPTNINQKDIAGNTPLISMARLGNSGAVAKLLELKADAKVKNKSNESAMDFAPDEATAALLFAKGADIKQPDKSGMTPLLYAVTNKHLDVAKFLLKNGASAMTTVKGKTEAIKNNDSQNAMHLSRSPEMAELFANKISINSKDNRGRTPLFYAAQNNNLEMVKYLLAKKDIIVNTKVTPLAGVKTADLQEGLTPLHVTSDPVVAQLLIDTKKIDINAKTAQGYTPLLYSLASGGKTVQTLLDNGANVKLANIYGMQPIHVAMSPATIDILLKSGAETGARDNNGSTPMHYAVQSSNVNWAQALIAHKATMNPVNNFGDSPLLLAKTPDIAKLLIENGANFTAKNRIGYTLLHLAAAAGMSDLLDVLLAQPNINVNAASNTGATPLFLAANVEIAKKLIDKGASLTVKDKEGAISLHLFVANGREDMVKLILAKLAEMNNKTAVNTLATNNITPAYLAAANSVIDPNNTNPDYLAKVKSRNNIMEILIKAGADMDIPTSDKLAKRTPLMTAVNNNNIDMVKIIANAKGTDLNLKNISGLTPLHWAAYKNYTKIMDVLINAHAKIDAVDNNNATPLFQAVSENNLEAVKILVVAGAAVNFKAKNNVTPLMAAHSVDVATVLLANGAAVNATRSDSATPLTIAINSGDNKMIQLMLNNKADIKIADKNGITPLFLAIAKDMSDLALNLISRGAAVNTANISGNTPLIIAVQVAHGKTVGNLAVTNQLLKKGANPNSADAYGLTAIHYATDPDIIKALIQAKANLNAVSKNGLTPLILAVLQKSPEKVKLLVSNGVNINGEVTINKNKITPIMIAMNTKNTGLVNLMKKLGATEPKLQPAPPAPGKPAPPAPPKKK